LKIPDMVSPQRTLRYPYNKVHARTPHHSWVDYGGEHHAGMGNGTHNLLIGGHESLHVKTSPRFNEKRKVQNPPKAGREPHVHHVVQPVT
jgi:hypothetical protein